MFLSAHVYMRVRILGVYAQCVCVCMPNVYLVSKQNNPPRVCAVHTMITYTDYTD